MKTAIGWGMILASVVLCWAFYDFFFRPVAGVHSTVAAVCGLVAPVFLLFIGGTMVWQDCD